MLQREAPALGAALRGQPAFELFDPERVDVRREPQAHRTQGHVDGRGGELAVLQIEPAAQRAHAFADLERQRDIPAQRAHIGARQVRVGGAAPALPVAAAREQRLREFGARAETITPFGGRCRVDPQGVLAQAIAHDDLHVGEAQWRGPALLVGPAQRAAADHEFALLKEPVGGCVVRVFVSGFGTAEFEPGDEDAATRIASNFELRAVDQQLLEVQLEREQRARRDRREHARQAQRGRAGGVEQNDITQLETRHPATRPNRDRADANRHPERLARTLLYRSAPLFDVGQNAPMECQPHDQQ